MGASLWLHVSVISLTELQLDIVIAMAIHDMRIDELQLELDTLLEQPYGLCCLSVRMLKATEPSHR